MNKKNITQAEFISQSNIPAKLVRAVIRQLGGWSSFKESAVDIIRHGIDGGFCGFIYYTDTVPFARRNRDEIASLAASQAEDFGIGVIEMIQGFNCLKSDKPTQDEVGKALYSGEGDNSILNALAWYAGEEVSHEYCRLTGQD